QAQQVTFPLPIPGVCPGPARSAPETRGVRCPALEAVQHPVVAGPVELAPGPAAPQAQQVGTTAAPAPSGRRRTAVARAAAPVPLPAAPRRVPARLDWLRRSALQVAPQAPIMVPRHRVRATAETSPH